MVQKGLHLFPQRTWCFNECLGWCAPSISPLGSVDMKVLLSLSAHLVLSDLRWHVQSGPMTNTPASLSLLDGPWGSDPAFFVIWSRFRELRRYLAYRPDEVDRFYRLLDYASTGSPGHGPIHLHLDSALETRLSWDSSQAGWVRALLRMMTGSSQHFRNANWEAWQDKVAINLCKRKGFRGELC